MLTRNGLIAEWRSLLALGVSQHREFDPSMAIRMIYGSDEQGHPVLFTVSKRKPGQPDPSGAIEIERLRRESDGRWTLSLILTELRLFDVFVDLSLDLARRGSSAASEQEALDALIAGIDEWRGLFAVPPNDHMSEQVVRGVIAELWFGLNYLQATGVSPRQAVLSWRGPVGAAKDYLLPDGSAFEVKSIHADSRYVQISSAEQLDDATGPTTLVTIGLEPIAIGGIRLPDLYDGLLTSISDDTDTVKELRRRFSVLGVEPTDEYYAEFGYAIVSHRHYRVNGNFPAIKRSVLPEAIGTVNYQIALSSLREFLVLDATTPELGAQR